MGRKKKKICIVIGIIISILLFFCCGEDYPDVVEWEGYTWYFTNLWRIVDNNYLEAIDAHEGGIYRAQIKDPEFDNLTVEVEIAKIYGNPDASMGLVLRSDDYLENGYYFLINISDENNFAVERLSGGNPDYLTASNTWETSPAVISNYKAWNKLRVTLSGDNFDFYINDTLVLSGTDPYIDSGYVNLRVAALYDQSDLKEQTKVWFRNFTITADE
ncbi:MAG: DUF1080 domain-containing protein [Spirochaetales bacterium]|nr:DUF1080 domain-containing protein [Spirochaetales bacterium]